MELSYKDKGQFLRGFLVLAKMDNNISIQEKNMAIIVGQYFGFDKKFCEDAVNELLDNEYISEEPPRFSDSEVANFFVNECSNIYNQLSTLNINQSAWLKETISINKPNSHN